MNGVILIIKYLIILSLLIFSGCTIIDHRAIPLCDDINATGIGCVTIEEADPCGYYTGLVPFDKCEEKDVLNAKCKTWEVRGLTKEVLKFCFETIEETTITIEKKDTENNSIKLGNITAFIEGRMNSQPIECEKEWKIHGDRHWGYSTCIRCKDLNQSVWKGVIPAGDWVC